jgi:hypothetical protein
MWAIIAGKFVTANDAAEEEQRPKDHPAAIIAPHRLTFEEANEFYRLRLRTETDLLDKRKHAP